MYENIVIAYDDSEFSRAALWEASHWIARHGGKATLVHSVFFDEEEFVIAPDQREKRFELGKKICYQKREEISAEFGLNGSLDAIVCEGEPHDVVVDVAASRKADLIAMGTHGRKGVKKLFMGSVTSRVVASSHCDVLIVKKACEECAGRYPSILVSFDGTEFGSKALTKACEFSKLDGSKITALYVIPRYEEMIEFFSSSLIKENLYRDAEKIMDVARKIAMDYGVNIDTQIADGDEGEKIIETAKRLNKDLIVRGTHGWTGINRAIIGSIADNVIVNSPCPVLVVK